MTANRSLAHAFAPLIEAAERGTSHEVGALACDFAEAAAHHEQSAALFRSLERDLRRIAVARLVNELARSLAFPRS